MYDIVRTGFVNDMSGQDGGERWWIVCERMAGVVYIGQGGDVRETGWG